MISALVEQGTIRPAYQAGISIRDFTIYDEEFEWLEKRVETRKPINRRLLCERFPDFEFALSKERLEDLLEELKAEKAYSMVASLLESVGESLLPENALTTAEHMREVLADVVRMYSPHSDIAIKDWRSHLEKVKQHRVLAKAGQTVGMPTLIPSIDYHWDGLLGGRLISILGRPGMGKTLSTEWIGWVATKLGHNIGLFSPEMDEFEHRCRIHTLASADKEVQEACGLKQSFRNRDLMRGTNFDLKAYARFCEYFDSLPGNIILFTKKYRKTPLTPAFIESKIEDLGLEGIIIDPIRKLSVSRRKDNPLWEAYDQVAAVQEISEQNNIFVIATNWATRQPGRKNESAPDLDDSFGSDALAQESDHVIGVRHDAEDRVITWRCSKSRFGVGKFVATIECHPNTGFFQEINIDPNVISYRLSQNGNALQNGSGNLVMKARK